jgi:osmotically-inducible protein OsmY
MFKAVRWRADCFAHRGLERAREVDMKNDTQLKQDVEMELRWEPSVHAERIGVSVKNGVVELDGHVDSFYEKWSAERAVQRVASVQAVASEIKVDLPSSAARTDEDIARTAIYHLEWHHSVPDTVKVKVTDGVVTLEGTADWQYQREAAEDAVRPLKGVKGVIDQITIKPKVSATDVKAKIEDALKRNAATDAGHIRVEASGATVILRGQVKSWAERAEAEHAAWAAPGVSKVDDQITIG